LEKRVETSNRTGIEYQAPKTRVAVVSCGTKRGTELTTPISKVGQAFPSCQKYVRQMNHLPTNEHEKIGEIFTYIDFNQGAVLISKSLASLDHLDAWHLPNFGNSTAE